MALFHPRKNVQPARFYTGAPTKTRFFLFSSEAWTRVAVRVRRRVTAAASSDEGGGERKPTAARVWLHTAFVGRTAMPPPCRVWRQSAPALFRAAARCVPAAAG